jgi:hypothetical protein
VAEVIRSSANLTLQAKLKETSDVFAEEMRLHGSRSESEGLSSLDITLRCPIPSFTAGLDMCAGGHRVMRDAT